MKNDMNIPSRATDNHLIIYNVLLGVRDTGNLSIAFIFSETPHGYTFWNDVSSRGKLCPESKGYLCELLGAIYSKYPEYGIEAAAHLEYLISNGTIKVDNKGLIRKEDL